MSVHQARGHRQERVSTLQTMAGGRGGGRAGRQAHLRYRPVELLRSHAQPAVCLVRTPRLLLQKPFKPDVLTWQSTCDRPTGRERERERVQPQIGDAHAHALTISREGGAISSSRSFSSLATCVPSRSFSARSAPSSAIALSLRVSAPRNARLAAVNSAFDADAVSASACFLARSWASSAFASAASEQRAQSEGEATVR
jgi:hypothetical protein